MLFSPTTRFFLSVVQLSILCIVFFSPTAHALLLSTYISVGVSGTGGTNCQIGQGSITSSTPWQQVPTVFTKPAINAGDVIMRRQITVNYPYYTALGTTINTTNPTLVLQAPPLSIRATGWYQGTNMSALSATQYAELTLNGQNRAVALRTYLTTAGTAGAFNLTKMRGFGSSSTITPLAAGTPGFVPNSFTATWTQEIVMDNKNVYAGGTPSSSGQIILAYADDAAIALGPSVLSLANVLNLFCVPTTSHPSSGVGLLTPYGAPAPNLPDFTIPGCTVTSDTASLVNLDATNSNTIANLALNQAATTAKNFTISLNCEANASVKMAFIDTNNATGGRNYLVNNALGSGASTQANGVGVQVRHLGPPATILTYSNNSTASNIATVTGTIITPTIPSSVIASGGRVDLPFDARYFRYANGISTGAVISEINVLFFYN